jgi:hypothetical protein
VRNAYPVKLEDGTTKMRWGCRFIDPPAEGLRKIQRYTQLHGQRNARRD